MISRLIASILTLFCLAGNCQAAPFFDLLDGSGYGATAGSNPAQFLNFYAPAQTDLLLARGAGSTTFTRNTSQYYINDAGVLTSVSANVPAFPTGGKGVLVEPGGTNLFLNSPIGVTQNITTTAQVYTLSFWGTGNIVRSGTSTGTLTGTGTTNRVQVSFTPTAGTLTLTVSGSCTEVQFETGSVATSYMPTAGSTATRAPVYVGETVAGNVPTTGAWSAKWDWTYLGGATVAVPHVIGFSTYKDASNYIGVFYNGVIVYLEKRVAGVSTYATQALTAVVGTTYRGGIRMNADYTMNLFINGTKDAGTLGSELYPSFDLTVGWVATDATILSANSFSSTAANGNVKKSVKPATVNGKLYKSELTGTPSAGLFYALVDASAGVINTVTTGTNTVYTTALGTGGVYLYVSGAGRTITGISLSLKEVLNNTDTTTPVYDDTFEIGNLNTTTNGTLHANGQIKEFELFRSALPDSQFN